MLFSGLKSNKWVIFAVLSGIYFFVYFHRTSPAVMADDLMREFAISALAIGILSSAYFYPYAVLQIPVGILSDVKGAKKVVLFFTLVTLLGILIFVMSSNYEIAVFSRLLIGIGVAGVYIPTVKIMSQWFKESEFATAMGILFAIGNFGAILSAYPLALIIDLFGWRTSFTFVGILTAFLLILCFLLVKDAPAGFKGERLKSKDFTLVFRKFSLWLIAISSMLRYGVIMGFQGLWGGPFLIEVYGISKPNAGAILMLLGIGSIIGAPILGRISDLIAWRKNILILSGIGFLFVWAPLVFVPLSLTVPVLSLISFLIGFFSSAGPVAYTIVKEQFPLRMTGFAISIVNVFPFIGAAIFQTIMGYLMDSVGKIGGVYPVEAYQLSFEFCFFASIASLLCAIFVKEEKYVEK
ncbi:MAG: MFS transporter [Archaeoglobaceae archaeon]